MEQTPIDLSGLSDPERARLKILLATTWRMACGISEHAFYLKQAVEAADPRIEVVPVSAALDPAAIDKADQAGWDLLHLNYQAAIHSRWTPDRILDARASGKYQGVVTTYHDSGVPNSQQCLDVVRASNAAVIHEPFDDLPVEKTYYWRMGVPESRGVLGRHPLRHRDFPYLGTVGFPFPWKCYDELCRVTDKVGWGIRLIAPGATLEDLARWNTLNPLADVNTSFLDREQVVADLGMCDATAFTYVCHNTGQSGAILQGIAAKKPVIALETCRQFRALRADPLGREAIRWCDTFAGVAAELKYMFLSRLDPKIVALAQQERWSEVGKKYASLYRKIAAGQP